MADTDIETQQDANNANEVEVVNAVIHLAEQQAGLSPAERRDQHLALVRTMFSKANSLRNLAMWAAGRVYVTMKEDPGYYGLDSKSEAPSQREFGRRFMGGAAHTTVARAAKIYRSYDPGWLFNQKNVTQSHLLCAYELDEEDRQHVLGQVDAGIAADEISTTEGAAMIQELKEPEEVEEWPKPADEGEKRQSHDAPGTSGDDAVEPPPPEPGDGGPADLGGQGAGPPPEPHEVGRRRGNLTIALKHAGEAYQELLAFEDNLDPDRSLTQKQARAVDSLADTAQDMYKMVQGIKGRHQGK